MVWVCVGVCARIIEEHSKVRYLVQIMDFSVYIIESFHTNGIFRVLLRTCLLECPFPVRLGLGNILHVCLMHS